MSQNPRPRQDPGREIIAGFLGKLEALGFGISERVDPVTGRSDTAVTLSGRPLCRVGFSTFEGRYGLDVYPADPASEILIAQARGRVHVAEAAFHVHELDPIEALFRTALVREGLLPEREFPTDYALRRWVAAGASVRLPHERTARRRHIEDVVFLPGELPDDSVRTATPVSKAQVNACRLLDVGFERDRALDVARGAASALVDRDGDKAQAYLAYSARRLVRGQMRDLEIAWDKGGMDRMLVLHGPERDDIRVPLSLVEETPAPRLW